MILLLKDIRIQTYLIYNNLIQRLKITSFRVSTLFSVFNKPLNFYHLAVKKLDKSTLRTALRKNYNPT